MAGLSQRNEASLARQQYQTLAWLRWRIFANSLRRKGATGELVVRILSYPVLALMILGPAAGAALAGYYCVSNGLDEFLAIPLWIIFALWQFIGASTSSTGPSFDLATLTRFPIRYREYLLIRLSFGLLDAPTMAGLACLIAMSIGIGTAAPALFPWAAVSLAAYGLCNILFSRMLYSWMERWLAQRRTRELIAGLVVLLSIAFQFAGQFAQRLENGRHGFLMSPWMEAAKPFVLLANNVLPPGLASSFIDHAHGGAPLIAAASLAGLLLYAAAFLLILHLRFHAQYLGENLSEVPAAAKTRSSLRKANTGSLRETAAEGRSSLLSPAVAAALIKEVRYLLRSGPRLYVLIMPVFVVLLFSARSSGMNYMGVGHGEFAKFLFSYGCAYTQLLLVGMLYNSLGSDGSGVQFYLLAPVRMRDVLLAKNLLTGAIVAIEMVLIYIAATLLTATTPPNLIAATAAWTLFVFLVNASIGNVRSLVSPKTIDPGKMRGQNISGVSGLISVVVTVTCVVLGYGMVFLCRLLDASYWAAAAVFLVLSALASIGYIAVLRQTDSIATEYAEDLIAELCKR